MCEVIGGTVRAGQSESQPGNLRHPAISPPAVILLGRTWTRARGTRRVARRHYRMAHAGLDVGWWCPSLLGATFGAHARNVARQAIPAMVTRTRLTPIPHGYDPLDPFRRMGNRDKSLGPHLRRKVRRLLKQLLPCLQGGPEVLVQNAHDTARVSQAPVRWLCLSHWVPVLHARCSISHGSVKLRFRVLLAARRVTGSRKNGHTSVRDTG